MRPRFLSHLVVAAVVACTGGRVAAQVAARSPFMPPQGGTAKAATEGAPLEYRGFIETSQGLQYRIYDPAKKAGAWIRIDQRHPDFDVTAKGYDNDQKTLTIEHGGKTLTLAERKPKIVSSGNAAQAMPPPPTTQPTVAPAVTQSVVLNPTPADEQRRLEAVAAEVARRRALREQATQQITQGNPSQVGGQPAQPMQPAVPSPQPGMLSGSPGAGRGPNPPVRQQR